MALVGGGFIGYQLTHREPPSFRRGGQFANGGPAGSTSTTAATGPTSTGPDTATSTPEAVAAPPPNPAPSPAATATTGRQTAAATATTVTTAAAVGASTTSSAPAPAGPGPSTAPGPPPAPAPGSALPAFGTYTYAVDGQEGASFVGSRRYPERMTTVVHGGGGVQPDQAVFDITYSSEHEERQIVGFRPDGIYFDFEGGSVTFGPRTETSEADYDPPMLQIPKPLQAGFTKTQVVKAKGANGSLVRTEDVKVTVIGQETVPVAGADVSTWKVEVDRKIRPGSADGGTRKRTYWLDPTRNIWVKYTEVFHGQRNTAGFSFTYDSDLTATLTGFAP